MGVYKMREMNKEERNVVEFIVTEMLQNAVSNEYAKAILSHKDESTGNTFMENVIRDVLENSAWKDTGHYSVSDVKFAIGRALMEKLGVEII